MERYLQRSGWSPGELESCTNLEWLDLFWNKMGDEGSSAVAESLLYCKTLETLCMGYTALGDCGAAKLAPVLRQCSSTWSHLDLQLNRLVIPESRA
eukprot:3225223-Rhodomonas_salina.2